MSWILKKRSRSGSDSREIWSSQNCAVPFEHLSTGSPRLLSCAHIFTKLSSKIPQSLAMCEGIRKEIGKDRNSETRHSQETKLNTQDRKSCRPRRRCLIETNRASPPYITQTEQDRQAVRIQEAATLYSIADQENLMSLSDFAFSMEFDHQGWPFECRFGIPCVKIFLTLWFAEFSKFMSVKSNSGHDIPLTFL